MAALVACLTRILMRVSPCLLAFLFLSTTGLAQDIELSCKFSQRTWKAAIEMTNATREPIICSALCVFGDLEGQTETLTLECKAFILPSFSREDYCSRDLAKAPGDVLMSRWGCYPPKN